MEKMVSLPSKIVPVHDQTPVSNFLHSSIVLKPLIYDNNFYECICNLLNSYLYFQMRNLPNLFILYVEILSLFQCFNFRRSRQPISSHKWSIADNWVWAVQSLFLFNQWNGLFWYTAVSSPQYIQTCSMFCALDQQLRGQGLLLFEGLLVHNLLTHSLMAKGQ